MRKRGKRLLAIILAVILLPLADIQLISGYSNISQNENFNSEYSNNDAILNTDGNYAYAEIHKKDKIAQNGTGNTADLLQTVENVKQLATYQAYNNTEKKNKLEDTIHIYRGIGNSINNNSSKKNDATVCVDYEKNLVGYTYNGQEKLYLCTNLKEKVNPYTTNTKGLWYFDKGYTSATASLISAVPAAGSLLGNGLRLGFKTSVRVQKGTKLLESVTHIVGAGATAVRGISSGVDRVQSMYSKAKNGESIDSGDIVGLGLDILTTAVSAKSIKTNLNGAFALKNAVVKSADGKQSLMPVNLQYFGGKETKVRHAVGNANQAQSVLDGINPKYFNPDSRFGGGFYVGVDSNTLVAELAEHGNTAKYAISYNMNLNGQKVLDLTNSKIASKWNYTQNLSSTRACQNIGELARNEGYNAIKFQSYRGNGINYVFYNNFNEILSPRNVTPIG